MIAISNEEMNNSPIMTSKIITCHICGKKHKIRNSLSDLIQYVRCGKSLVMVGAGGRNIQHVFKR